MFIVSIIEVDFDDMLDFIFLKVVYVVFMFNQYVVLCNEFIVFIYFGFNIFIWMEWGMGMEDLQIFDFKNLDID